MQREHFLAKSGSFFLDLSVQFEPLWDGNVDIHDTTKELKKKALKINSQNIEQEIWMLVTFIFEIEL